MIQYEWDKKWNCRAENARDLSPFCLADEPMDGMVLLQPYTTYS